MKKALVEFLYKPVLRSPVLVEGLPGVGSVGVNVARALIDGLDARPFARLISPLLPDFVIVEEGICRLPMYVFYAAESSEPNLIILTGDAQPAHDDGPVSYTHLTLPTTERV